MLKHFAHITMNCRERYASFIFFVFAIASSVATNAQSVSKDITFGLRAGLNMTTLAGSTESGLDLGFTAGVGAKYNISDNSSFSAELLYTSGGMSTSKTIDSTSTKVKVYDKTHLHYLAIPIVYQYYFKDILGLEIGPQIGFCLGGKDKNRIGNESWISSKLTTSDYNVFDCGLVAGIYTNDITQENDFFISLRAYFGLTNVMKNEGNNKNICIQFGVGYFIGK